MPEGMGPKPNVERTAGGQPQAQEFQWQAALYRPDEAGSGGTSRGEYGVFKLEDVSRPTTLGQKAVARISRQEGVERLHAEKDPITGKSVNAVRGGVKAAEQLHAEKDPITGKSVNAVRAGARGGEQTNAEKDEQGRSKAGVKAAERMNAEKDPITGKSVNAVRGAEQTHAEKDPITGKSVNAVRGGVKGGEATKDKWEAARGMMELRRK
jgi:hypothetical protein